MVTRKWAPSGGRLAAVSRSRTRGRGDGQDEQVGAARVAERDALQPLSPQARQRGSGGGPDPWSSGMPQALFDERTRCSELLALCGSAGRQRPVRARRAFSARWRIRRRPAAAAQDCDYEAARSSDPSDRCGFGIADRIWRSPGIRLLVPGARSTTEGGGGSC